MEVQNPTSKVQSPKPELPDKISEIRDLAGTYYYPPQPGERGLISSKSPLSQAEITERRQAAEAAKAATAGERQPEPLPEITESEAILLLESTGKYKISRIK